MLIKISSADYKICEKASRNRWSNKKRGFYGRGLINTSKDKCKVERIGLLGEMAFSKIFKLEVDTEYRHGGDKYDFLLKDKTVDVKTAARNYETGLIYAFSENGKEIPLKCDIYVFCYLEREDKTAEVKVVGWITREEVKRKCEIKIARIGKHKNYEVPYSILNPMEKLIKQSLL